jgi:predicted AAA+ superfamily ATPase
VDFFIKQGNGISSLIQVSESFDDDRVRRRETDALVKAMNELKVSKGLILIYGNEEKVKSGVKNIMVKSIYKWAARGLTAGA